MTPNPAVNADAPVRPFNLASRGGGAPVTLIVSHAPTRNEAAVAGSKKAIILCWRRFMKRKQTLSFCILIISGSLAGPSIAHATDKPSTVEPISAPTETRTVPAKPDTIESKRNTADHLKWDQLDQKSLERAMKKPLNKSPFVTVPAER